MRAAPLLPRRLVMPSVISFVWGDFSVSSRWVFSPGMTGAPRVAGLPEWPAYDPKADLIMDFTLDGPKVAADAWRSRLDLAEAVNDGHEHVAGTK